MSQNTGVAPGRRDRLGGGVEGERGHDHLVARADAHRPQRDRDRLGAVGDADRVPGAAVVGELALERARPPARGCSARSRARARSPRAAPRAARRSGVEVSNSGTAMRAQRGASSSRSGARHQPDQLLEARLRLPAEVALGLGRVADQVVDLGRAHERGVDRDVLLEVAEAGLVEGDLAALAHRVRLAGRDHVVLGVVALEHQPHRFDVVLGVAPVAFGVEVAEAQLLRRSPCLIAAACQVILRVTNSSPRRGLSWLKRIPEVACRS